MFEKSDLDALFGDLEESHGTSADYDRLLKQTHLAVALSDAQRPLDDQFDSVVIALVEKHKPAD